MVTLGAALRVPKASCSRIEVAAAQMHRTEGACLGRWSGSPFSSFLKSDLSRPCLVTRVAVELHLVELVYAPAVAQGNLLHAADEESSAGIENPVFGRRGTVP